MTGDERREARAAKLRARSDRKGKESSDAMDAERKISQHIPMGQPILIGHHSEKRHRRDIKRMQNLGTKAYQSADESKSLSERADSVEDSSSISIQDDDAARRSRSRVADYRSARMSWMRAARCPDDAVLRSGPAQPRRSCQIADAQRLAPQT